METEKTTAKEIAMVIKTMLNEKDTTQYRTILQTIEMVIGTKKYNESIGYMLDNIANQ